MWKQWASITKIPAPLFINIDNNDGNAMAMAWDYVIKWVEI